MARYFPDPSISTFLDFPLYINTITDNFFGIVSIVTIFMIFFISFKRYPFEKSFSASSFITAVSSYFLSLVGLFGSHLTLIPTAMFLLSIFLLYRKR